MWSFTTTTGWLQETGAHCVDLLQTSVAVARRTTPYRQTLRNLDDAAYVADIRAARCTGCNTGRAWGGGYWWVDVGGLVGLLVAGE